MYDDMLQKFILPSDTLWSVNAGGGGQPPRWQHVCRRYRKRLIRPSPAEIQRIEITLEEAGIKLGSAASELISVSGRAMLDALNTLS